jgi:hypothetical protein
VTSRLRKQHITNIVCKHPFNGLVNLFLAFGVCILVETAQLANSKDFSNRWK